MQVQHIGYYVECGGCVCDPVVIRYYNCPPVALVLPIPLAFGVCRCHITVYDCVQLNIGCNDLLTRVLRLVHGTLAIATGWTGVSVIPVGTVPNRYDRGLPE